LVNFSCATEENREYFLIFPYLWIIRAAVVKLIDTVNNFLNQSVQTVITGVAALIFSLPTPARTEVDPMSSPFEIARFGERDTLRGIVAQYLHDADLWPAVLAINNIASPADLRPGIELRLPVHQVRAADSALTSSLSAIQKANAEGARIFAPVEIGTAIENRDAAMRQRTEGEWRLVVSYASLATDFASEALIISLAQRDRAAEAVVSDVQGDVEGRTPSEPHWSDRRENDIQHHSGYVS
jgi:hypothetical protein